MSTHVEHLCPPPFAVLFWLIVFSSMMIMISLAVKQMQIHKHLPWQTSWQESVIVFFSRRRRTFLKENALNWRHYQFYSCHPPDVVILSSICFCVVLCMWTHQHQRHPWARLCHTCWVLPKHLLPLILTWAKQVLSVGVFENCILNKMSVDSHSLLYARFVTGQVSQHR